MVKNRQESRLVEVIDDIICNRCKGSCRAAGQPNLEETLVTHTGGYGSDFPGDLTRIEFHLCEACLKWLVGNLTIPPQISSVSLSA